MEKFRKLKADEIELKVGSVTAKGFTLLLYKNARCDMNILDEVVGAENWQNKFYEVCGNLYCSLGIRTNNFEWIWKDDCGVESDFGDKEKGQASDARKRAGFAWGIGRELYTAPFIFIKIDNIEKSGNSYKLNYEQQKYASSLKVADIDYDENGRINKLIICDRNGEIIFTTEHYTKSKQTTTENKTSATTAILGGKYKFASGKYKDKTIEEVAQQDESYLELLLNNEKVSQLIKDNIKAFRGE